MKEFPILTNKSFAYLILISAGAPVQLDEDTEVDLRASFRLIKPISPVGNQWVLTPDGEKVVKAMLAVGKVMTLQDALVGHIDVELKKS